MKAQIRMGVVLAVVVMVVGFLTASFAQCVSGLMVGNSAVGTQSNVLGLPDDGSGSGTIVTKFWIQGNSLEHSSGTVATTDQISSLGGTDYDVWSDWGKAGVLGDCPASTEKTVFLYSIENGGVGQYILLSTSYADYFSGWDFDAISPSSVQNPSTIPSPTLRGVKIGDTTLMVGIDWTPIADLKGYYDVDPQVNLITGIAVRYYQGSDSPPSDKSSDWNLGTVVSIGQSGADPGFAQVLVPNVPGATTYVALSLLFDGASPEGSPAFAETDFVGGSLTVTNLPPPPLSFASVSASRSVGSVVVGWTMASESNAVSYQVFAASRSTGLFKAASGTILRNSALGGTYSASLRNRFGARYFKVGARDNLGLITYSDTVSY